LNPDSAPLTPTRSSRPRRGI